MEYYFTVVQLLLNALRIPGQYFNRQMGAIYCRSILRPISIENIRLHR